MNFTTNSMPKYHDKKRGPTKPKPPALRPADSDPHEFSSSSSDEAVFSAAEDSSGEENVLMEGEEEDEDSSSAEQPTHWGTKRSAFYKDSGSEEDSQDEEEEVVRLAKKRARGVRREDLELLGEEEGEGDEEEEEDVVRVKSKRTEDESPEETLASEAPEVLALMAEFTSKSAEVSDELEPLLESLKNDPRGTKEGVTYVETKIHLLLSYVTNVAFYLAFRAENGAARAETHPVVQRLVRIRTLLDKLRPLDLKLKKEIDDLVRRAMSMKDDEEDAEEGLSENGDAEDQPTSNQLARKGGRAPTLDDLMPSEEQEEAVMRDLSEIDGKRDRRKIAKAQKSELLQHLKREMSDAPSEIVDHAGLSAKETKEERARRVYEEEHFTRLPGSNAKKAASRKSAVTSSSVHGGDLSVLAAELEDDEYSKLQGLLEDSSSSRKKPGVLSRHVNEMEQARKKSAKNRPTGDDDVEYQPKTKSRDEHVDFDLEEQRMVRGDKDDDGAFADYSRDDVEEPAFYRDAVDKKRARNQEKHDSYSFPKRYAPEPVKVVEVGQQRSATKGMIKNRGLTPHRSKDAKNPRKNMRMKYEAKVKARKSQVRDIRTGEGDYYQGEKSGVRTNIVRSRIVGKTS